MWSGSYHVTEETSRFIISSAPEMPSPRTWRQVRPLPDGRALRPTDRWPARRVRHSTPPHSHRPLIEPCQCRALRAHASWRRRPAERENAFVRAQGPEACPRPEGAHERPLAVHSENSRAKVQIVRGDSSAEVRGQNADTEVRRSLSPIKQATSKGYVKRTVRDDLRSARPGPGGQRQGEGAGGVRPRQARPRQGSHRDRSAPTC